MGIAFRTPVMIMDGDFKNFTPGGKALKPRFSGSSRNDATTPGAVSFDVVQPPGSRYIALAL
jgi:hypothetical protein